MPPKKSSKKDDVEALLSDLDNLGTSGSTAGGESKTDSAASTGKPKDDAQSLLDDLDELVKRRAATPKRVPSSTAISSILITDPATTTTVVSEKSAQEPPSAIPAATAVTDSAAANPAAGTSAPATATTATAAAAGGGGWGGSWWSSAQKLADQARAELEKRAAQAAQAGKDLAQEVRQSEEEARRQGIPSLTSVAENASQAVSRTANAATTTTRADAWSMARNMLGGGVESSRRINLQELSQMGKKGWMDIVNAVAPPIARHEVLQVSLSHDMIGYEGIDDLVFRVLGRVVETHAAVRNEDGGDTSQQQIIVNKSRNQQSMEAERTAVPQAPRRSLNPLDEGDGGFASAWKTAESKLDALIQSTYTPPEPTAASTSASESSEPAAAAAKNSATLPITTCPLYLRIQPLLAPLPGLDSSQKQLYFVVLLNDPLHSLVHRTISSPIPAEWFEEGEDDNTQPEPWAEEFLVEILEACLGSLGLDYVRQRQTSRKRVAKAIEERVKA